MQTPIYRMNRYVTRTRWRDVPYEEIRTCMYRDDENTRAQWNEVRGTPILIETTLYDHTAPASKGQCRCAGPWWKAVNVICDEGTPALLCAHMIEID